MREAFGNEESDILLGVRIMQLASRKQNLPSPVKPKRGPYPCPFGRTCGGRGLEEVPAQVYDVEFLKETVFSVEQGVTPRRVLSTDAPPAADRKEAEARGESVERSMLFKFHGSKEAWMQQAEDQESTYKVRLSTSKEMQEDEQREDQR